MFLDCLIILIFFPKENQILKVAVLAIVFYIVFVFVSHHKKLIKTKYKCLQLNLCGIYYENQFGFIFCILSIIIQPFHSSMHFKSFFDFGWMRQRWICLVFIQRYVYISLVRQHLHCVLLCIFVNHICFAYVKIRYIFGIKLSSLYLLLSSIYTADNYY